MDSQLHQTFIKFLLCVRRCVESLLKPFQTKLNFYRIFYMVSTFDLHYDEFSNLCYLL